MENSRQNTRFKWRNAKALEAAVEKGNIKTDGSLNVSGGTQLYRHAIGSTTLGYKKIYLINTTATPLTYQSGVAYQTNVMMYYSAQGNPSDMMPIKNIGMTSITLVDGTSVTWFTSGDTITDGVSKL